MKPSRKERKRMRQKAAAGGVSVCIDKTETKRKKCKEQICEERICFHFASSVYVRKVQYHLWDTFMGGLSDETIMDFLIKVSKKTNQPAYAEPAKSGICRDEDGAYVCSVCGTR